MKAFVTGFSSDGFESLPEFLFNDVSFEVPVVGGEVEGVEEEIVVFIWGVEEFMDE